MTPNEIKFKCKRCGKCCIDMGTIWTGSSHPLIAAIRKSLPGEYYAYGGRCVMLVTYGNGETSCLLEQGLGRNAKPRVCREYEGEGHCRAVTAKLQMTNPKTF